MPRYRCEVLQDGSDDPEEVKVYDVVAPSEELAQLIAFTADGGFYNKDGPTTIALEYDNLVALAKSYTSANPQ